MILKMLDAVAPLARAGDLGPNEKPLAGTWQVAFLGEIEPRAARPESSAPASETSRPVASPGCQIAPVGSLIIIGGLLALLGDLSPAPPLEGPQSHLGYALISHRTAPAHGCLTTRCSAQPHVASPAHPPTFQDRA